MQTRPTLQGRKLFDAIMNATTSENEEVAIELLATIANTDVYTKNPDAVTIYHLRCGLLDDKHSEMTVLMAAAKVGSERLVKCIIDMISFYQRTIPTYYDFDFVDTNGNTALMHAAMNGKLNVLKILVATGKCDPTVKNSAWLTALDLAKTAKHHDVVAYLTEQFDIVNKRRATLFADVRRNIQGPMGLEKFVETTGLNQAPSLGYENK